MNNISTPPLPEKEGIASSADFFDRILDSTPDGIMVVGPDRRILVFNRACGELLGRDPHEVLSGNWKCGDVVNCHLEDGTKLSTTALCPARDLFEGRLESQVEEMLATTASGAERWIETSYSPVRGADGEVEFVIGILRDVHERKRLEMRLREAEKLASLGQLTAGIAHEIKNPLGIILSSVELILDESRPREIQREAAEYIREEVKRLDSRIRAFLGFARPSPARPEPTVLNGLVRRTAESFRKAFPGIHLDFDLQTPEFIVMVDPDQIQQVLANLVLNAVDAGGQDLRMLLATRCNGDEIRLEVHDDGPGIPADIRREIFNPFFTTKADGTGLGLAIVSQIIMAHHGNIVATESPLGGAQFSISLPLKCASPQ
jgi:PAS domain S-box-containing protein